MYYDNESIENYKENVKAITLIKNYNKTFYISIVYLL